jgi:glycosyltransferase involved in cell wall biosynthesis
MKAALGPHTSAPVLYPIATPVQNNIMEVQSSEDGDLGTFTVLYFGNLFEYGPMLAAALGALIDHATIRLEVRGRNPNWPANFLQLVRNRGLWRDFAPRAELDRWLTKADAYLIPMTFETRLRRRMETCFPSKLSELSQFGKPLVIWGPEYCSAIRWAQQNRSALCVPNENPAALVAALENLARSGSERIRLSKLSKQAAQREFDPENLQSQFHAALARALDNHYSKFSSRTHCGSAYLPSTTRRV